jgi:hypothetical protein
MDESQKVVTDVDSFDGDVPAILPDGWQEGQDLLPEGATENADALLADGPSDDELLAQLLAEDSQESDAPTTGADAKTPTQNAGVSDATAQPDGAAPAASAPRKLTLKVNHQEQTVDITSMSDDDLRVLLQKGYAFDAMKDAEDRRAYLAAYQEQLDAGMTDTVARLVAKDAAGGKTYEVKDGVIVTPEVTQPQTPVAPAQPPAPPQTGGQQRDLRAEVEQFRTLFPDVREMPNEVAKAVAKGVPVVTAYLAYREGESAKAANSLRKENKTLRQNAANVQRAPVKGVSGSDTGKQKTDPFTAGFDAGWSWN